MTLPSGNAPKVVMFPAAKKSPAQGLGLSDRDIEVATLGVWGQELPLRC